MHVLVLLSLNNIKQKFDFNHLVFIALGRSTPSNRAAAEYGWPVFGNQLEHSTAHDHCMRGSMFAFAINPNLEPRVY